MKKIILAIAAISIVFASCVKNDLPPPPADDSPLKGKLFINEVNGWPSDDPSKNFELYNGTDEAINLNGFVVTYTEERETWRGRAEDVIPAKGWKLIQGANAGYPGFNTGLSNRNPNVCLTLFDTEGKIVDYYEKVPDLRGTPLEYMCHMRIPDAGKWYYIASNLATPGAANLTSVPTGAVEMPPMEKVFLVELVSSLPALPTPDNDVTITVRVTDANPISAVMLKWKKDNTDQPDVNITNTKDGSLYTATVPKQADGTVVDWIIEATNSKNAKASVTGSITFAVPSATDYTKLKLNEVSGVGGDAEKFYELINTGTEDINLAGCQIFYNANGATGGTLPAGDGSLTWTGLATQIIEGGQLFCLIGRDSPAGTSPGSFTTGLTAGRILIITLKDPAGNVIDQCIRAEDTGIYAFTDKSFSRIPDGTGSFYFTDPTPNAMNGNSTAGLTEVPTTQTPVVNYTALVINEVNGCTGEKWFEIYNTGTEAINLDGVKAYYSNSEPANYNLTWTGAATDNIAANGWFSTKGLTLLTGLSANNVNVRLQLRAPDGTTILDTYEKLKNVNTGQGYDQLTDKAHARVPDGTGPWYYTTNTLGTPDATNGTSTTGYVKIGEEDGAASTDYTKLRLNEISGANLFIELYNSGTTPIDLEGVRVQRNGGPSAGTEWVGQAGDVIPAGAYRLIAFRNGDVSGYPELTDVIASPSYVGWIVSGGLSNQQILKIALVDPDGIEFDVFIRGDGSAQLPAWGTGGQTQNNAHTYSRMPNGTWAYALPTIGAANGAKVSEIVTPGYLKSELVLNEISGEQSFVEVFNAGTNPFSLKDYVLSRNDGAQADGVFTGIAGDVIPAGSYAVFAFNNGTGLPGGVTSFWSTSRGLSDQQTLKIALINPLGFEFDVFVRGTSWTGPWGTTGQERRPGGVTGLSYSRQTDGTWGWAPGSPGSINGTTTTPIVNDGYLTAQP